MCCEHGRDHLENRDRVSASEVSSGPIICKSCNVQRASRSSDLIMIYVNYVQALKNAIAYLNQKSSQVPKLQSRLMLS
jgi:hypothetical protein